MSEIRRIGYIELGHAGYHLAPVLVKANYGLILHDTDTSLAISSPRSTLSTPQQQNLTTHSLSPASIILITMRPNGLAVRLVLEEYASHLKDGTSIV